MTPDPVFEQYSLTNQLRWVRRKVKLPHFYNPAETVILVLQQAWQGSNGSIRWEDVPEADDSKETN